MQETRSSPDLALKPVMNVQDRTHQGRLPCAENEAETGREK